MASLEELRQVRIGKMNKLREAGMNPFAPETARTHSNQEVAENFTELQEANREVVLAGRVMAIRGQGAIMFVPIYDGTATFQAVIKQDDLDPKLFELFSDTIDIADFIEVTGTLFMTERGAQSLLVKGWKILTKALRPLPDKHKGLQDQDEKYRKRYLDILMNPEVANRFRLRAKVITAIRHYFDTRDFMEVETPILQNQAGGALARTFETHHNDYDMDMVLRIAVELQHKMIMVGGYPRIYGIDKDFRNEGTDPTHLQEFTMMEWYAAYETLEQNIAWTEDLLRYLAKGVVGETTFTVYDKEGNGVEVDFDSPWPRKRFDELLLEYAKLDMHKASPEEIKEKAREYGMSNEELATTGQANILDFIYKKSARLNLINPTFVMNYPSDLKPLAQQNEEGTAQVAQLIIGGAEITNQYAELVDPMVQRALLERQSEAKAGGDEEAMEVDDEFLTAMEHGMPPMTGFGMGIDRLMAIFTNQKNVRDVVFFPIMKPRGKGGNNEQ